MQDKAADAARWLGYIPFDRIVDQRNAKPFVQVHEPEEPYAWLRVGLDVDIPEVHDLEPRIDAAGFDAVQPYRIVLMGEKHSLREELEPIARTYGADLYLPTGEPSDTMIYNMARIGAADGRPMVVLYFADCDPAGWQMPISMARKLQAFRALAFHDFDFEVYRVALSPEQVREHQLPSNSMKATEKTGPIGPMFSVPLDVSVADDLSGLPSWFARAACSGMDTELCFAGGRENASA